MIQFQCQCADCLFTDYIPTKFSLRRMKRAFSNWQHKLRGRAWNMLYLENHDHPRIIPRYGSEEFWKESGKTLAVAYLFQQGTPFVYQGQEIGMLNWRPASIDQYRDVQTIYNYHHDDPKLSDEQKLKKLWRSSRDSARTPVQWDDTANAGFTTAETPWMDVNVNYRAINVAQQEADPDSILNFYRKAIRLRKELPVVRHGSYRELFRCSSKLYCYAREMEGQKILVLCSFSKKAQKLPCPSGFDYGKAQLLLHNYRDMEPQVLKPYESRVYLWK